LCVVVVVVFFFFFFFFFFVAVLHRWYMERMKVHILVRLIVEDETFLLRLGDNLAAAMSRLKEDQAPGKRFWPGNPLTLKSWEPPPLDMVHSYFLECLHQLIDPPSPETRRPIELDIV
jgi:hypothetical protein